MKKCHKQNVNEGNGCVTIKPFIKTGSGPNLAHGLLACTTLIGKLKQKWKSQLPVFKIKAYCKEGQLFLTLKGETTFTQGSLTVDNASYSSAVIKIACFMQSLVKAP